MNKDRYQEMPDAHREFMQVYAGAPEVVAFTRNAETLNAIEIKYSPSDNKEISAVNLLRMLDVDEAKIHQLQSKRLDRAMKQEIANLLGKPVDFYRSQPGGGFDLTYVPGSKERFRPERSE